MTAQPARRHLKAAALALCGMAVLATTVLATTGFAATASAATSGPSAETARQQSTATPVVVNCARKTQVRPGSIVLACADGNVYVGGLSWTTWGSSSALASGSYAFNDCTPNCLSGHGHTFPALVVLWGAKGLPGHSGVRFFSEMTLIFTGSRSYTAGGKTFQLSQTMTILLSQYGGA
jgi:hypothetical protein